MKRIIETFLLFTVSMAIVIPSNIHAQRKMPIVIGSIIPLTGPFALEGFDIKRGTILALEEVNAAGGVLGRPLKVVWEDTVSNPTIGMRYAKKLAEVDKVPLILGEYSHGVSFVTGKYTNRRQILQIAMGWASPKLRRIGPYFFNVMGLADIVGTQLGEFALEDSGANRVGFITVDSPFGIKIENWVKEIVKQKGGRFVSTVRYRESKKDYRAEIQKLFQPKPQIVFFTPIGEEATIILKQASAMGFKEKIGWYSSHVNMWATYVIPETAEGIKGLEIGAQEQLYSEYANKYEKRFGIKPITALSSYAYDATWMAALAINHAKSTHPDDLRSALFEISQTYEGVTGYKKFDKDGMQVPKIYNKVIFEKGKLVAYSPCPLPPFCRKQIRY